MGIWSKLKMDLKIVHHWINRKGSKTRQNDEVQRRFFMIFHDFLAKSGDFMAQRAYIWQNQSKTVIFG